MWLMEYLINWKHEFMSFFGTPCTYIKKGTQFDDKSENVALYVGKLYQS